MRCIGLYLDAAADSVFVKGGAAGYGKHKSVPGVWRELLKGFYPFSYKRGT